MENEYKNTCDNAYLNTTVLINEILELKKELKKYKKCACCTYNENGICNSRLHYPNDKEE